MSQPVQAFGGTAQKLARNPLGLMALFIVLVYAMAALVITFADTLTPTERLPLLWFLVIFPILVLGVYAWLVSRHSSKLFALSDFRDEDNYVRTLSATASLAIASVKTDSEISTGDVNAVVNAIQESTTAISGAPLPRWRDHVLWVDDRPDNNIHERRAFEAVGLSFTLARSTSEAL